jgi:hypoxanthine phosphoribosyltransferase
MTIAPLVSNWYKDQEKSVEKGNCYEWSVMLAGGRGGFAPGSIWWHMGVCPAE